MCLLHRALAYYRPASLQVFTGEVPFSNSLHIAAMLAIMGGKRPQRPTHPNFTDELWALMRWCWDQDPRLRPAILEALNAFRAL